MELKDLELVTQLKSDLQQADQTLRAFENLPDGPVQVYAEGSGYVRARVELLPVDKSVAVSAAQRKRSKVVAQLQSLGVTVA